MLHWDFSYPSNETYTFIRFKVNWYYVDYSLKKGHITSVIMACIKLFLQTGTGKKVLFLSSNSMRLFKIPIRCNTLDQVLGDANLHYSRYIRTEQERNQTNTEPIKTVQMAIHMKEIWLLQKTVHFVLFCLKMAS